MIWLTERLKDSLIKMVTYFESAFWTNQLHERYIFRHNNVKNLSYANKMQSTFSKKKKKIVFYS